MILLPQDLTIVKQQNAGKKIILTSGTFDLFHVGHLHYLQSVSAHGDVVVVMLSGDARVKSRKGANRPIIPENERAEILDSLEIVDYLFIDPGSGYHAIVTNLQPDLYVTDGEDIRFTGILDATQIVILPRVENGVHGSTTEIINYITGLP